MYGISALIEGVITTEIIDHIASRLELGCILQRRKDTGTAPQDELSTHSNHITN